MPFDISSAIPISEKEDPVTGKKILTRKPEFDLATAEPVTVDKGGMTGYQRFVAGQLDAEVKAAIHRPIDESQVKHIQEMEKQDPGAFQSFAIPYTEGIVGFFTKPFGYRPDLSKPFGLTKGPKTEEETQQDQGMQKEHPIATTLGQIVAGTAPFIAAAPLFPASLLGTLATFETVGLTQKIGDIQTDESLMTPMGQKGAELGIEAVKSGIMAPIWHYSGALKFIGRPFLSAVSRAGIRGGGQATLSAVFGTDIAQSLKEGGMITALSLIFETPALAKTALGRGIISRANEIASAKGLPEGKYTINVDKLDEASMRSSLFNLVKGFYNLMRFKIDKVQGESASPKADPYSRFLAPSSTVETPGQAIAPRVTLVPPGSGQPMAGGMVHRTEKQPVFYSKMMATLAEKMPEKATPEQVQGIIKGAGISPDEVDMSGIKEFLQNKSSNMPASVEETKIKAFRYGKENNDVIFSSKNKDYSEEYATVKGGKPEDVKEVTISANNPLTVDLSQKEFSDPAIEKKYIDQAKKQGNDLVIFRDKVNGDEFYAQIKPSVVAKEKIKPGQISKTELLDYLKQNQMQVEEVWKGQKENIVPGDWKISEGENGTWVAYDANDEPQITGKSKEEVTQKAIEFAKELGAETTDARYRQYILPGGENYREILFRIPPDEKQINGLTVDGVARALGYSGWHGTLTESQKEHINKVWAAQKDKGGREVPDSARKFPEQFKSSHWEESNVLAHTRLTDRTTTSGKKVLFVEEMQSDWARKAREEGFIKDRPKNPTVREDANVWVVHFPDGNFVDVAKSKVNTGEEAISYATSEKGKSLRRHSGVLKGVPSHPLIKHWQPLILKRLLRYAAENGYDYISWTTGEQQADRYDLSKQVDGIEYYKLPGGVFKVCGLKNDDTVFEQIVDKDKLDTLVGKDIAKRIINGEGKPSESEGDKGAILEGADLKVGGGWAKNLYDQQIPNWFNDYLKKFGSNVEAIKIKGTNQELIVKEVGNDFNVMNQGKLVFQGSEEEAQTYIDNYNAGYNAGEPELIQQAVPITPELKKELVYAGQPLFGKMPQDIGQPGAESKTWKFIFRLTENVEVINTRGEKVNLPKGEEYHTLSVLDKDGNIVPGKIKLQDGKQITVYEGELGKLKGHLLPSGEVPLAGGLPASGGEEPPKTPPKAPAGSEPEGEQPSEDELREAWEAEMNQETQAKKDELKNYLSGKLKYELKNKGEYEELKHLSWLWAKQDERGYGPDELTELFGMGFDVGDPSDSGFDGRVIEIIKSYFNEDIQAKAADAVARANKSARQKNIKINESFMKEYHRDLAKALRIRAIEGAKIVARIEKLLSRPLARTKVKQIIRENTGIIKISDVIGEDEALQRLMQREQSVSKEAFRAGKETGREELKAHQAEIKARKVARDTASSEVNGMISDIREIGHHLGVLPVDYQDAVKEILNQYDIPEQGFKRSTQTLAMRDARRRYVQEMEEAGEEVNIPEEELDLLEKITPNEMTVEDLRRIHLTLQRLYYQGKIKNKLIAAMEARDFEEVKEEGVQAITAGAGLTEENNIVKILKEQNKSFADMGFEGIKNFVYEHLRPEIMIHGLDGWKKGSNTKVIWDSLFDAFLEEELNSSETFRKIQETLKPLDLKNAYKKQPIGQFKEMTKSSAYFVYANSFNEHNYQALLNTGFTEKDIEDIESFLRVEEKASIQDLLKYYSDVQHAALDKVHVLLNGIHMPKEEFYFPLMNLESKDGLLKDLENQILKRHKFKVAGVASGFTKKRATHKSGFQQFDFFGVVLKNWEQVEHYKAYAPVIRDVRKYLGNLEIKKAIEEKFGRRYYDILQNFLKDVAYGGQQALLTQRDKGAQFLRTNYVKAVLSFNLLSPLRQFLGVLPAMHFVGKVPIMKAMLKYSSNPGKWWSFTDAKSPLLKFRAFSSEREMREMIARRDPQHRLQKFTGATNITEFGMLPLVYIDKVICQVIWLGAYDSTIERGGSEENAVALGNETVRRTQNMGDLIFLADAFRGNMWDKILTTFKNENNQNFNLNYENWQKTKAGQQGWGHFVDGVIFLFILPALLYGWTQRKRIQENAGEILNDLAGQALGGLMYLGDATGEIGRRAGTGAGINPVGNMLNSIVKTATASNPETMLDNAIKTIAFALGLPYIGVKRILDGQLLGKSWNSGSGGYRGGIKRLSRGRSLRRLRGISR